LALQLVTEKWLEAEKCEYFTGKNAVYNISIGSMWDFTSHQGYSNNNEK